MSNNNKEMDALGDILSWAAGLGIAGFLVDRLIKSLTEHVKELKSEVFAGGVPAKTAEAAGNTATATAPHSTPMVDALSNWAMYGIEGAAVAGILYAGSVLYQLKQAKKYVGVVRIIPHAKTKTSEADIHDLVNSLWYTRRGKFSTLYKGPCWFELLFHCDKSRKPKGEEDLGEIAIYLKYPRELKDEVFQVIRDCYRNCELVDVDLMDIPFPVTEVGTGGVLTYKTRKEKGLPFQSFEKKEQLSKILSHMRPGSYLSFTFRRATKWKLKRTIKQNRKRYARKYKDNPPQLIQNKDKALVDRQAHAKNQFDVQIKVWSELMGKSAKNLMNNLQRTLNHYNELIVKETKKCPLTVAPFPLKNKILMTGNELATLLKLPDYPKKEQVDNAEEHITSRIPSRRSGQNLIAPDDMNKGVFAGTLDHPVKGRKIFIPLNNLNNMLIVGTQGSGKTSEALEIIRGTHLPKFFNGEYGGFFVYDPKKEFWSTLLTDLRKWKMEHPEKFERMKDKIHIFDVRNDKYTFGLNLLEQMPGQTTDEVVNTTIDIIRNAYESESAWFKKYARLSLKALMADKTTQHTILAVPEFLKEDSPLRERIMAQLANGDDYEKQLYEDLEAESKHYGTNKTEPLLDRLTDLKDNELCKRVFGQPTGSIDFLKWVEEGHIVLINGEGLNESEQSILMGYLMMQLDYAARHRKNKLEKYFVFLDEAHNLKKLPILHEQALPKWRSKGIVPILLTQFLDQFHPQLRKSVSSLVDNILIFRSLGEAAQDILNNVPDAKFDLEDLTSLKSRNCAVVTFNKYGERITFFMTVQPPYTWDEWGEAVDFSDPKRASMLQEIAWKQAQEEMEDIMERDGLTIEEANEAVTQYLAEIRKGTTSKQIEKQLDQTVQDELSKKRKKKNPNQSKTIDLFKRLEGEGGE